MASESTPSRRILIECSHTFYDGQRTGIQRVVRELVAHGPGVDVPGVKVSPVIWTPLGFAVIDALPPRGRGPFRFIKTVAGGMYRALVPMKTTREHAPGLNNDAAAPIPARSSHGITTAIKRFVYTIACLLSQSRATLRHRTTLGPGDILLLADASWNQPMWHAVRAAHARGCRIGVVLYDLIALEHPEWFNRPLALNFQQWIDAALVHADFFLPISAATDAALHHAARERNVGEVRSAVIPLGVDPHFSKDEARRHEGTQARRENTEARTLRAFVPPCLRALPSGPLLLCVATIEPRKNHTLLLHAFTQLQQQDPNLTLAFVGRAGWQCEPIIAAIRHHPAFNKRLFWFASADDATLDALYRRAALLLVPSLAEGFGLPIIEGLIRQVPVLCADIPIFREVGGTACTYAPHDPAAWAAAIQTLLKNPAPAPPPFTWPDWSTAAATTIRTARAVVETLPPPTISR